MKASEALKFRTTVLLAYVFSFLGSTTQILVLASGIIPLAFAERLNCATATIKPKKSARKTAVQWSFNIAIPCA
jgi:hypothetical protein